MRKDFLTVDQLKQLWQNELLPSIRKGVNAGVNGWMQTLKARHASRKLKTRRVS